MKHRLACGLAALLIPFLLINLPAQETTPSATSTATPEGRKLPPFDPDLQASKFSPGVNPSYSQVYVKGPYIAMTFDDGPSAEYTLNLLDELKKRNIKATFFLIGQNVVAHPEIVRRIVADGHEVGNHSWTHPAFAKMSDAAVTAEISKTQDAIFQACGVKPTLMRPPYGSVTKRQKTWIHDTFGLQVILWSVDPLDWKKPGEDVVRSRIVKGAENGAIILAHDIHGSTVHAMPSTLDELAAKGYQFVTVSQLLNLEQPKPTPATKTTTAKKPTTATPLPTPAVSTSPTVEVIPTPIPLPQ